MEKRWCWRCQRDVGYLDDQEAALIDAVLAESARSPVVGDANFIDRIRLQVEPAIASYVSITREEAPSHPNVSVHFVMKHRLSRLGRACLECGKPLRTPRASICAACGWRVPDEPSE